LLLPPPQALAPTSITPVTNAIPMPPLRRPTICPALSLFGPDEPDSLSDNEKVGRSCAHRVKHVSRFGAHRRIGDDEGRDIVPADFARSRPWCPRRSPCVFQLRRGRWSRPRAAGRGDRPGSAAGRKSADCRSPSYLSEVGGCTSPTGTWPDARRGPVRTGGSAPCPPVSICDWTTWVCPRGSPS
jgi:hypothetical protein